MTQINFGTDGWRAVIGEGFTPENVTRVIQAFCDLNRSSTNKVVFVGYDRRKDSAASAELVARVLADNDFRVMLSSAFCPTPCVSWLVKSEKALAGVMVTASHNPPQWNGIKFKESYGGAASPEYTSKIEKQIEANRGNAVRTYADFADLLHQGRIQHFDPRSTYIRHLRNFIDVKTIAASGFKIAVDPLYGAGTGFIAETLEIPVFQIHGEADTNFGGLNPEPIEKNLTEFRHALLENKADVGLATDGDADRIGALDENGDYVNSHQIFALLLKHHVMHRKLRGPVVKSVSTTQWIDRICAKYGLPVVETPIGFKHICKELLQRNALMGGEESGGISLREHVHERDGVFNGLMLLEMMALHKKRITGLLEDLYREFGRFFFSRDDYHLTEGKISEVKTALDKRDVAEACGIRLKRYNHLDGTKFIFEDNSWLLMRASGTEPLLRVYAEALSQERVNELLNFARERFRLTY